MFDLLICSGSVVSPESTSILDVAITGKEIQALGKPGAFGNNAKRTIDATGHYVIPGAIDPHTHFFSEFLGGPTPSFEVQSVAAAHGGTTTYIDFSHATHEHGLMDSIRVRAGEAEGKSAVDYALHAGLFDPTWDMIQEVDKTLAEGIPSFKVLLHSRMGQPPDDGFVFSILNEVARKGGIVGFHAENQAMITYYTNRLIAEGKTGIEYFSESRPNIVEAESVRRLIYLSEQASAAVYFFHLSSKEAVAEVAEAKAKGLPVYCETCPHYLAFNDEEYRGERAIEYVRFPPIRSAADQNGLWQGVIDGTIDCIGTDHVTAFLSVKREKSVGKPFTEIPGGMPQVETRLPFMFSEGVSKGRISVNRLVELVSTNPAKIFGLYPQKGSISAGSDADIVLIDPNLKKKITSSDLHMGVDYTVYENWVFTGMPVMTIVKGKVAVENGKFLGSLNDGAFLRRSISENIRKGGRR